MSSSLSVALIGLGGVVIGGTMTMVTTWWQASTARKSRLTELEVQLRHERFLRDETARRTAMLELVYIFRRFAHANVEADRHHKHDRKIGDQLDSPIISKLIELGQTSFDLLDKDASLLDEVTRNTLECARDKWEHMHAFNENFPDYDRNDTYKECCPIGGDFQIMEMAANEGVWALERKLDAMRFI